MSDVKKIFTLFIIFIILFNPVLAADTGQSKEKIIDNTKEKETKITNKDKSITGDIKVTTKDVSKFSVKKKSNYEISISKSGEHAKAKVSFPKSELDKIDIDKDGKFGILHIDDNGVLTHTTATEAELVAGKEMTFSTNVVNGYSGYKQYTFSSVTSGQTLNIDDVSGNYTVTVAVGGTVPTYTAIVENNTSTYPSSSYLVAGYDLNANSNNFVSDNYDGTATSITYSNGGANFKTSTSKIQLADINNPGEFSVYLKMKTDSFARGTAHYSNILTKVGTDEGGELLVHTSDYTGNRISYRVWKSPTWSNWTVISSLSAPTIGEVNSYGFTGKKNGNITFYKNGNILSTARTTNIYNSTYSIILGGTAASWFGESYSINGTMYTVLVYNKQLNTSDSKIIYAGGSGISLQPEPSYNFTGYSVASGVEKVIDTDSTCTGLEYVDTTGGTHDVTVTVYFTEDITEVTDSHTALVQTVNITHTSTNTADNGSIIPYEILDGYDGTATFQTNNNNATISRNETTFVISTGYLPAGSTYYYLVEIPNPVEEMLWYDWNPDNETCNAKVQIGNSTPYTTWNITTYNVTNGSLYKLVYASNGTEVGNATAVNGSASIIIVGLADGVYWLTETSVLTGFVNVPAVAVVIIGAAGAFVGGSFINKWYRRRRGS